eukprot:15436615-Alexandrium_andersonii.AAC.1
MTGPISIPIALALIYSDGAHAAAAAAAAAIASVPPSGELQGRANERGAGLFGPSHRDGHDHMA